MGFSMPAINTNPAASGSKADPSPPKSPFPYSPDSYCLPTSITSPSHPESFLLPTNSPTFLVSRSDFKPAFKVPTSSAHRDTREGINTYVEWVEKQDEEDENEGLLIFPSYYDSGFCAKKVEPCEEDFELLAAAEFTDDSYSEQSTSSETETDSNASSRSSSPSLEGEDFDCDAQPRETWSKTSCLAPEPTTLPFFFAEDDLSLGTSCRPAHCVDFLAHDWKTSDLLASYKHVHSRREGIRASQRLESALWRVWWRDHLGLERVNPEVIHWYLFLIQWQDETMLTSKKGQKIATIPGSTAPSLPAPPPCSSHAPQNPTKSQPPPASRLQQRLPSPSSKSGIQQRQ